MHDGCFGQFENGKQVVDKVRMMGYNEQQMPAPLEINCVNCDETFMMETFEVQCPSCDMTYATTPCHAFDATDVKAAGINY